jgi:alpha-tubulin suppressor-like RCC1 family protein
VRVKAGLISAGVVRFLAAAVAVGVVGFAVKVAASGTTAKGSSVRAIAIAAGYFHTCAVTRAGGVKCWGLNGSGQLGDGTTVYQRDAAVDVSGLVGGVAALAAGDGHTCALTSFGGVQCWGNNTQGQLGDGTTTRRSVPAGVSGLASGVVAIAAGYYHTCALTRAGGVKCWGWNGSGQLGDGTYTDRLVPVDVSGLASGVAAIAAGGSHTCALTSAGGVKCWGARLLYETDTDDLIPVGVVGLASGVAGIAAGDNHTCAVTRAGGVKCWGDNTNGQLGDGTRTERPAPVDVSGLASGVAALAAGGRHTCAFTSAGGVKCWGRNRLGQLGDGTTTERHAPVEVSGLTNGVAALTAGFYHTCALTSAGAVKCWGDNGSGQLGDGTSSDRHTPVEVISVLPPCIVPNVIGKRLPIAKTAIRKAYCRAGKVIYRRSANARKNRVMAESPTAGKHLKNGAKVKLIVGRGPRRI